MVVALKLCAEPGKPCEDCSMGRYMTTTMLQMLK
jgi:hypothetical protein